MRKKNFMICLMIIIFMIIFCFIFSFLEIFDSRNFISVISSSIYVVDDIDNNDVSDLRKSYNNDEVVGVLRIMNSDIVFPITQSNDNDKYLSTDIYGNYDKKGNPFLDYRVDINTSNKLLVYGHNSKKYIAPFTVLENYYNKDYYDSHQYIELTTDLNVFRYEIFSVYVEPEDWSYMQIEYKDDISRIIELENYKLKSMYDTGVEVNLDDDLLILQTCSYKKEYLNYDKKYLLIVSRRVK